MRLRRRVPLPTPAELLLALATRLERTTDGRRPQPLTVGDLYAVSRHHTS